jgi:ribonuclease HII
MNQSTLWWSLILSCSCVSAYLSCTHERPRYSTTLAAKGNARSTSKPKKKQNSLESLLSLEIDLQSRGYKCVIGSDDAGGAACIAGPVVCASCCLLQPFTSFLPLSPEQPPSVSAEVMEIMGNVNDSKMLSRTQINQIYDTIMAHPQLFAVSVAHRTANEIDDLNLLRTTQLAFAESIETLVSTYDLPRDKLYAIVDGKISPKLYASDRIQSNDEAEQTESQQQLQEKLFPVRPKVNADAEVYACALASIVAGVEREKLMKELHLNHPEYGFERNLGRASKDHIEALHRHGAVQGVHRYSFKQVKGR